MHDLSSVILSLALVVGGAFAISGFLDWRSNRKERRRQEALLAMENKPVRDFIICPARLGELKCQRQKNHPGLHRRGGFEWEPNEDDFIK